MLPNIKTKENYRNSSEYNVDSLIEFNLKDPVDIKNNLTVTVHRTENIYNRKKYCFSLSCLKFN